HNIPRNSTSRPFPSSVSSSSPPPPPHQQHQQPPPYQQRAGGQARVYTITHDEAARNAGTMSGMLSISHVPVFALCDTGATHSFISSRCLEALSIGTVHACDPLEVSLASGKIIISDSVVRNLSICIGGRVLEADVYVLDMRDFDVILGMDWLTRYQPISDARSAKSPSIPFLISL
ncbi:Unknown protein, partial [Striga hermonthica]